MIAASEKIDELKTLLRNVKNTGTGFTCLCPSHDDHHSSMSVSVGDDGKILLKCHANSGCTFERIAAALNKPVAWFFPDKPKHSRPNRGELVATFDYRDTDGTLLFQSCRYETASSNCKPKKTFSQRRPDGNGGWLYKLGDVKKVPYRLPELIDADPSQPVLIVEGEKHVDRLRELGFVATCNAGGAGKWRKEFGQYLRDWDAIILPDNDPPGEDHTRDVESKLRDDAKSINVLILPGLSGKGDILDWLEAGGTADQLRELLPTAKPIEEALPAAEHNDDSPATLIKNAFRYKDEETGKEILIVYPMQKILASIQDATDNWPRRVGTALFVHENGIQVDWLEKTDALFGWMGTKCRCPAEFNKSEKCHTKAHVFAELRRTAQSYLAVAALPHEPPIEGTYYACEFPPPGDGPALRGLVDRYNPASDIDGDLITGMYLSTIWGGAGGSRPLFVVTSDVGRGAGKTTLASHVGYFAGGALDLSANENAEVIKQRLLSPEGMTKRVAILDNVKTLKFSWAELESMITAPTISGKRMFVGEGTRQNNLLWTITLNGVSLAKDLSKRAVIIKLGRPTYSGTWDEDTRQYIDNHRQAIIADCIALLRSERHPLHSYSRWGSWERDVLQRLPDPSEAQAVILERQAVADVEDEESGLIQEHFAQRLRTLGYDADHDRVFIPSGIAAEWYCEATRDKASTTAVSRRLKQGIEEGSITLLKINPCNTWGRGFIWWGPLAEQDSPTSTDIESRIEQANRGNY